MRIGIFTDQYYPSVSGLVTSIKMLYEGLEAMGHECFIFTSFNEKKIKPEDKEELYKKKIINIKGIPYPFKNIKDYRFTIFTRRYIKMIKKYNLDVIHVQTEYSISKIAIKASKKLHIPIVHTLHTSWKDYIQYIFPTLDKHFHKALMKIERNFFTKPISDSSEIEIVPTKKVLQDLDQYGMKEEKIRIVPTGIEVDRFDKKYVTKEQIIDLRRSYKIDDTTLLFVYIGRTSKEKNIETLIEAFTYALNGKDAKLMIVGGGPDLVDLKQSADDYVVSKQVIFTGQVPWDNVPLYYHAAQMFINASQSETQGLTYIEALSTETPVLVQKDLVLEDLIIDGYNGYIFDGIDDLVSKLQYIYENKEELNKLKENTLPSIQKYSKEEFTKNVLAVYDEAIENYKKRA